MPDNPNNPNPPNNPPHVPTLVDKQIDLSAFQLMDFDQEKIRNLPKPRTDFAEVARQVLALYPDFEAALKLTDTDFDPDKVAEHLYLADQLVPYADWLERRAEQSRCGKPAWCILLKPTGPSLNCISECRRRRSLTRKSAMPSPSLPNTSAQAKRKAKRSKNERHLRMKTAQGQTF